MLAGGMSTHRSMSTFCFIIPVTWLLISHCTRHRHVNVNQKRYAVASALAATAVPALVMARGHRVEEVPEFPLVVDNSLQSCAKTASALATLKALGAAAEIEKVCSCWCNPVQTFDQNMRRSKFDHNFISVAISPSP